MQTTQSTISSSSRWGGVGGERGCLVGDARLAGAAARAPSHTLPHPTQYAARLNTEKLKTQIYRLSEGRVPKKYYNMRLAPEEVSGERPRGVVGRVDGMEHSAHRLADTLPWPCPCQTSCRASRTTPCRPSASRRGCPSSCHTGAARSTARHCAGPCSDKRRWGSPPLTS